MEGKESCAPSRLPERERFGLPETAPVVSCYEAGRDGFWLHRYLLSAGVENVVVDSSSIEVNRRYRRAKTDQLDLAKLLTMLIRYHVGEKKVWRVVRAPTLEEEDNRQLHRELETLKAERTQHINRIKGLLAGQGVRMEIRSDFLPRLESLRLWDGSALPPGLLGRLEREYQRLQFVNGQIKGLERERVEVLRHSDRADVAQVRHLLHLNGMGINSAWLYVMEFFAWRRFRNRREVGAFSGLTPTPRQSGDESRELGISKSGNRHVRAMAIEIAWGWLRYQPESALSQWYEGRFAAGSSRVRRIGIVALARKLLIELWRYLETGAIPEGATLKSRLI